MAGSASWSEWSRPMPDANLSSSETAAKGSSLRTGEHSIRMTLVSAGRSARNAVTSAVLPMPSSPTTARATTSPRAVVGPRRPGPDGCAAPASDPGAKLAPRRCEGDAGGLGVSPGSLAGGWVLGSAGETARWNAAFRSARSASRPTRSLGVSESSSRRSSRVSGRSST